MIRKYIKGLIKEVLEEMFLTKEEVKLEFKKFHLKEQKSKEEQFFYLALTHPNNKVELDITFYTAHNTDLSTSMKFSDFSDLNSFIKKANVETIKGISKVPLDIVAFKEFSVSLWYDYAGDRKLERLRFVDVMNSKPLDIEGIKDILGQLSRILEKYPEITI